LWFRVRVRVIAIVVGWPLAIAVPSGHKSTFSGCQEFPIPGSMLLEKLSVDAGVQVLVACTTVEHVQMSYVVVH